MCADVEILLIRGNHDLKSGDPWPELSIKCLPEPVQMEKWACRHHPLENGNFSLSCRSYSPWIQSAGNRGGELRDACFWVRKDSIVLPAFGSFTGLKNVMPSSLEDIYLTNNEEIVKVVTQINLRKNG